MRLLKNFDEFIKYYDIDSKEYLSYESLQKTVGSYKIIKDKINALMVQNHNLYFIYGEQKIKITDSHKVLINKKNKIGNEFCLKNGKDILVKFNYSIPNIDLNISPFEYIDEDDFKWGDFLAKIINDKDRKNNFIVNLSE